MAQLMNIGLGLIVTTINYVLIVLEKKIAFFEAYKTKTDFNINLARKLSISFKHSLNSILILLITICMLLI